MAWYDSVRFGVAEILAAGTSLFWRGKLNFLAPLDAEDNATLGTTDVGMASGTVVGQLLAWTGSAWSASSVLRVLGSGDINLATSVFKFLDGTLPNITVEQKTSGAGAAMYIAAQGTASGPGGQAQLIGGPGTTAGGVGRLSGGSASAGTGGDCVIATGDGSTADGSVKEYIGGTGGTLMRTVDADGHDFHGSVIRNARLFSAYEITNDGNVTLDYANGDHFWVGNSTITSACQWTLPSTGVSDGDEITVSTRETTYAIQILGGNWRTGTPSILLAAGYMSSITYRRIGGAWDPIGHLSS